MIKGDHIKLIKPMGVFNNVGEICEVVDILENGLISFRFGEYNLGYMSYDEFERYFELVEFKKEDEDSLNVEEDNENLGNEELRALFD